MLEQLRQSSQSIIIWVLFAIIILAFVLTFGTQGDVSFSGGCSGSNFVLVVNDHKVEEPSWRYGMNTLRGGSSKSARSQRVLDALLEREILAQAAEEAGFRVTQDMATEAIAEGRFLIFGQLVDGKAMYFNEGYFDYERLKAQVNALGLSSVEQFVEEQQRELEAQNMRDLLLRGALASPEEAQARFIHENTKVTIDVLQLRAADYRRKIVLTDRDLNAYLARHESEVRAKYDTDEALYKDRKKEIRVRQIMMFRDQPKTIRPGEEAGAEGAEDTGAGEDPALVKMRELKGLLGAGADFATLALEHSDDERSKAKGGDLGWRTAENPGLGAQELANALAGLELGAVSEVIEVPRGYYLLKAEDSREGDLSFDQVKHEIANTMALEYYAEKAARLGAEAALAKAQAALAAGTPLDQVFERQAAPPPTPPGGGAISPEELQRLLDQLPKEGSLMIDGPDRPAEASWQGGDPPANPGDQPAPAAAADSDSADTATATGAAGEAAAGDATAAGATTGDSGSGSASASASASADDEELPFSLDIVEPKLRSIGPFTRDADGMIFGLGSSEELMTALFDELGEGQLADKVYEITNSYAVVRLTGRQEPNLKEFEENKAERLEGMGYERGFRHLSSWLESRCQALIEAQQVGVNKEKLNQIATEKEGEEFNYRPSCSSL
ncbi:peptidylprolyl isomerase [Haliangium sp.]|uniref:peptidylprolyl isomerase n=1 Tax=Haliangium sp. TaxID=2663208 RepID=UPI003D0B4AC2